MFWCLLTCFTPDSAGLLRQLLLSPLVCPSTVDLQDFPSTERGGCKGTEKGRQPKTAKQTEGSRTFFFLFPSSSCALEDSFFQGFVGRCFPSVNGVECFVRHDHNNSSINSSPWRRCRCFEHAPWRGKPLRRTGTILSSGTGRCLRIRLPPGNPKSEAR